MRTIVWWAVWGLVVSAGVIGLLETTPHHVHLLLAFPLLTGAAAAALLRMKYEYEHAVQHAKWLVLSSIFLMSGMGYLYTKANAYGPFSTGTTHKAFLGTTFGMSIPEVERALGRRINGEESEKPIQERAQDWILQVLPLPEHPSEGRFELPLTLYHIPCKTLFLFKKGKLGRVEVQFESLPAKEGAALVGRLREELEKEYKPAESETSRKGKPPLVFRKESVEAAIEIFRTEAHHARVRATLQYLPFLEAPPPALSVEANAF